jgi:uncharacterized small protein (DUF1192 family)
MSGNRKGTEDMDPEDLEPRRTAPKPRNLEIMGIEELEAYIAELQAEIDRAQAAIDSRKKHRSAADALFKS